MKYFVWLWERRERRWRPMLGAPTKGRAAQVVRALNRDPWNRRLGNKAVLSTRARFAIGSPYRDVGVQTLYKGRVFEWGKAGYMEAQSVAEALTNLFGRRYTIYLQPGFGPKQVATASF